MKPTERVAIVTGSTGGIGEAIARRLGADGFAVVVSGRNEKRGQEVACVIADANAPATFIRADLAIPSECTNLIDSALEHFGRIDLLVNNAAAFPAESFDRSGPEVWDEVFSVNVRGAFLCCRHAVPAMQRQGGGAIINIGSTLAYRGSMDRLAYACSKGALLTMTKGLARGLLADRIRVNWVTVGWVVTPGEIELREQTHGDAQAYLAEVASEAPLGRLETADEVAAAVAYLASDEAEHVTGCELNVSGGRWI